MVLLFKNRAAIEYGKRCKKISNLYPWNDSDFIRERITGWVYQSKTDYWYSQMYVAILFHHQQTQKSVTILEI